MLNKRPIQYIGVIFAAVTLLSGGILALSRSDQQVELNWRTFIEDGVAEKSVFVRLDEESLWRVTPDLPLWMLNEPLFATTDQLQWGPFHLFQNALGPYPVGEELGFTLADWLRADGMGRYSVQSDMAFAELSFTDLVPNSVYTLWCIKAC